MQYLRSLLFTIFLFAFTPLCGIVIAISWVLPYRYRYGLASWYATQVLWMLKVLCGLRYEVRGLENLPPGNHITFWKHSSAWETISMMVLLPPAAWVLKRELMWLPGVGWGLAALRPIAINREAGRAAIAQVVDQGKARLKEGLWVVIFPEGTRTGPGESRRYGVSGAMLAIEANAKIVPVAHDAGDYWPRRGLLKKPGVVQLEIGPPIDPVPGDPRATNEKVQAWIDATVARLRAGRAGAHAAEALIQG
jgi:1-acyl-sn-glycerol-3-phosphate acyltransferase